LRSFGLEKFESNGSRKQIDVVDERQPETPLIPLQFQGAVESILIFSTGALLLLFILCGVAITWEAYAVASKNPLPDSIALGVSIIGPKFTPLGSVVFRVDCNVNICNKLLVLPESPFWQAPRVSACLKLPNSRTRMFNTLKKRVTERMSALTCR
jgi:hypothetical protein